MLFCVLLLVTPFVSAEETALPQPKENAVTGRETMENGDQYIFSPMEGYVIVREGASERWRKLFLLPHNTAVAVLSAQCGWSRIRTADGKTGYIANTALSPSPGENALLIINQREFNGDEDFFNSGTIAAQGCGLIAAVNAVYYHTGNLIDIYAARDYMKENRCFTVGSKRTNPTKFFSEYVPRFSVEYVGKHQPGDENWGDQTTLESPQSVSALLREHIKEGHFFVVSIGDRRYAGRGHYVAIVDYSEETDEFLFLDSDGDGALWTGARASWHQLTFNPCLGFSEPYGRYQFDQVPDLYVYELWEFQ